MSKDSCFTFENVICLFAASLSLHLPYNITIQQRNDDETYDIARIPCSCLICEFYNPMS